MKRSKLSMALTLATAMGGLVGGAFAPSAGAVNISAQGWVMRSSFRTTPPVVAPTIVGRRCSI